MQTFLPFADFAQSARVLDSKRLGKQRVECIQLLRGQWANHPASKMWRGHEWALACYAEAVCQEWIGRGYKDTCLEKVRAEKSRIEASGGARSMPVWLGDDAFHLAHRSNLMRKAPHHYRALLGDVRDDLEYVWPQ